MATVTPWMCRAESPVLRCPTAPERSRSPPSERDASRSEATFPGGAAEEQEPSGSVCPSVCLPASRRSLSGTRTHTDTHPHNTPPVSGFTVTGGHGSSAVLLPGSPLRDVPPSDAPVPVEEQREEEEGASPSVLDHQADSPPERLNTRGGGEEEEEEEVGESEGLRSRGQEGGREKGGVTTERGE